MRFSTTYLDVETSFLEALTSDQSDFEKELSSGAVASASNPTTGSTATIKLPESNQSSRINAPAGHTSSDRAITNDPWGKPRSSHLAVYTGNRGFSHAPTPIARVKNRQPSRVVASAGSSHTATANPLGNYQPSWLGPPGSNLPYYYPLPTNAFGNYQLPRLVTPIGYPALSHAPTADPLENLLPPWMLPPPSNPAPNHALPANNQRNRQPSHPIPPAPHSPGKNSSRRPPSGSPSKNGILASGSGRVSKRGPKPVTARKYTSLLKTALAKSHLSKGAARPAAVSLIEHGPGPSPFADANGVKDQRPQGAASPSDVADTIPETDIEWDRWVNLDMCDIDSTQEPGYEATPPRKMLVRPVDLKGNYGLLVES